MSVFDKAVEPLIEDYELLRELYHACARACMSDAIGLACDLLEEVGTSEAKAAIDALQAIPGAMLKRLARIEGIPWDEDQG